MPCTAAGAPVAGHLVGTKTTSNALEASSRNRYSCRWTSAPRVFRDVHRGTMVCVAALALLLIAGAVSPGHATLPGPKADDADEANVQWSEKLEAEFERVRALLPTLDYGAAETLLRTAKARVGPRPSTFRYPQVSRPARHCLIQQHRNTHGTRTSLLSHSVTPAGQDRALGRAFCRESCERPCLGVHAGRSAWFRWHPFRLSRGQGQRDRLRLCQVRL